MEARISTLLKKLGGKAKKITSSSVQNISKLSQNSTEIITKVKDYDYVEPAKNVGQRFLKFRRKTINFYRGPINDISHLSIILVIAITLSSGVLASINTKDQVQINPFTTKTDEKETYLSNTEKIILEADTVTTIASTYDRNPENPTGLYADAAATTEDLYKKASLANSDSSYIAAVPILSPADSGGPRNAVTKYVVQNGDTLSGIAMKFNITTDTIRYANNLSDVDSLKPGDELTILPTSGILHTVSGSETTASLAKRYGVSEEMILSQNNLYGEELKVGMKIMIPDAEIPDAPKPAPSQTQVATNNRTNSSKPSISYVQTSTGPNHFPYGWCTWWVAHKRYVPWNGNAWQWYGNAQAYGRPVGKTPVPGAILVTWESGYGHVAYVESVSGSSFTVSEMNYNGFARVSTRTVTTSSVPLIGFIY